MFSSSPGLFSESHGSEKPFNFMELRGLEPRTSRVRLFRHNCYFKGLHLTAVPPRLEVVAIINFIGGQDRSMLSLWCPKGGIAGGEIRHRARAHLVDGGDVWRNVESDV